MLSCHLNTRPWTQYVQTGLLAQALSFLASPWQVEIIPFLSAVIRLFLNVLLPIIHQMRCQQPPDE